jgi:hypothetical protein
MASSAKKLQSKLFSGIQTPGSATPGAGTPPVDPGLSIHIPKPPTSLPSIDLPRGTQADASAEGSAEDESVTDEQGSRPYRERLFTKLGSDYEGVERYRLQQDNKRERHWKRWGPYLSERQWVSTEVCLNFSNVL